MRCLRLFAVLLILLAVGGREGAPYLAQLVVAQTAEQPQQQNEYVPIDQLPPQDQLPAAPLLVTAYSVVLVGLFIYVVSVARRLTTVQREIDRLESDLKKHRQT